jgi:hypothetical protein
VFLFIKSNKNLFQKRGTTLRNFIDGIYRGTENNNGLLENLRLNRDHPTCMHNAIITSKLADF